MAVLAYVGLGGNLAAPARVVAAAMQRLASWPGIRQVRASRLYRTEPWGRTAQPAFVNAVVEVRYEGTPNGLLDGLMAIEREAGRLRDGERWGPRMLDLDLLVFGNLSLHTPTLRLPHAHLHERAFVLAPLADLAPALQIPGFGDVASLLSRVDATGVTALDCGH